MSFTGLAGRRIVEPGAIPCVPHAEPQVHDAVMVRLEGPERAVDVTRTFTSTVHVGLADDGPRG